MLGDVQLRPRRAHIPQTPEPASRGKPIEVGRGAIRCAACGHAITSRDLRIEVESRHAHVFVNPHGIAFEIGCFAAAPGVVELGAPETAFTWFAGYSWQVNACASCRGQLGWRYRAVAGRDTFYGLILAELDDRDPE